MPGVRGWVVEADVERFIERLERDRRLSQRYSLNTALRVRVRKTNGGERRAESENLSQRGVFFATDLALSKGAVLDLLVDMPQEVTGEAPAQWLCTGHVVRVVPLNSPRGAHGIGVQFDYYECREPYDRNRLAWKGPRLVPELQH